jgi:hypothetical protein
VKIGRVVDLGVALMGHRRYYDEVTFRELKILGIYSPEVHDIDPEYGKSVELREAV